MMEGDIIDEFVDWTSGMPSVLIPQSEGEMEQTE